MAGKLYFVPTPIGNLKDITLRALEILNEVDIVLAEDTRNSVHLLNHFDIKTPLRSYHMHNEHKNTQGIISEIINGKNMALISDAGTPGISDPGYLLAKECVANKVLFEVLPGATAFVPALVKSALPNHSFVFEGFLPVKKGRMKKLEQLKTETRTMILYESPYKIEKTLKDLLNHFGNRKASVSRELTKIFEETINSDLVGLAAHFKEVKPKGEFVIIVEGLG